MANTIIQDAFRSRTMPTTAGQREEYFRSAVQEEIGAVFDRIRSAEAAVAGRSSK